MISILRRLPLYLRHEGFRKYLHNSGWMFFARVIGLIISFVVTTYVVRYLGPENYGQLSYAVSFIGILSVFVTLGLDQIIYREIITNPDKKNLYLGTTLVIKLFAGIITSIATILITFFIFGNTLTFWLISIISFTFLFNCWNVIGYEFQADVKSKYPALISVYVTIILSIGKILVVYLQRVFYT